MVYAGLHNSESSKDQIDQHKLAAGRKSLFRHSVEEILKGQVIIRSRAFATFSATESSRAACGPRAVCCEGLVYSKRSSATFLVKNKMFFLTRHNLGERGFLQIRCFPPVF